jgi:hypothetical protein
MSDYFVFQSEDLFLSKFIAVGIIHSLLSFFVIQGSFSQRRQRVLFLPASFMDRIMPGLAHRLGASTLLGVSIAVLSSFSAMHLGPQTLLIVNAAFLTVWYVECAILLAFGFFARLFNDELPFEIRLFVSFVIMVNAGYFTLMFLVSLLRAQKFI